MWHMFFCNCATELTLGEKIIQPKECTKNINCFITILRLQLQEKILDRSVKFLPLNPMVNESCSRGDRGW